MSLFKSHPHLFANGKFSVKIKFVTGNDTWRVDHETLGYLKTMDNIAERCTLIARPISDMSDEERNKYKSLQKTQEKGYTAGQFVYEYVDTPESFLYLLSIGVYPGPQDDEDVIFEPTNKLDYEYRNKK